MTKQMDLATHPRKLEHLVGGYPWIVAIAKFMAGRARIEGGAAMGRNIPPSSPSSSTGISAIGAHSGGMEEFEPFCRRDPAESL